jgi:pectinesterase
LIVSKDGSGDFSTISDALDSINNRNRRETIFVRNGIYKEKVHISSPFVSLIGEDPDKTILTYDDYAKKPDNLGAEMGTFNSYSILITGEGFEAESITFQNSSGPGRIKGQAIAAYVDADKVRFRNCKFLGYQDTLFTGPLPPTPIIKDGFKGPDINKERLVGRHLYENCYIEGDIDFIFGSAAAVFKGCTIMSLGSGYITAASTPHEENIGYVFLDCTLSCNCAANTVYLGRPWRDYAKTVFINCYMEEHIKEEGWHNWSKPEAEKTAFYAEYNSRGPGGKTYKRVNWTKILTLEEAKLYQVQINKVFSCFENDIVKL